MHCRNAAGGHTRYWLILWIFDPPFVQGHIPFLFITCLWNLFSLSQLLSLVFIQIVFTHVEFAENKNSGQWEDFSFLLSLYLLLNFPNIKHIVYLYNRSLAYLAGMKMNYRKSILHSLFKCIDLFFSASRFRDRCMIMVHSKFHTYY